jgi:O-antigen/teichoic acid export membrane protein
MPPDHDDVIVLDRPAVRAKTIATGAGVTLFGKATGALLKFGTQVSLTRLLGAGAYGVYAEGLAIFQVAELLAGLGLGLGTVRWIAVHIKAGDERRLKGVLQQAVGLPLVAGGVVGAVLFLASGKLAEIFGDPSLAPILRLFAIAVPLSASMTTTAFATTGFQVTKYLSGIWELLLPAANLAFVLVLCGAGLGVMGAAVAWIAAVIVALAAAVAAAVKLFPRLFSPRLPAIYEPGGLLRLSMLLGLGDLAWLAMLWTDVLVLGFFQPASEVGPYRAASQVALLLVLFLASINSIATPLIADSYHREGVRGIRETVRTAARWSITLTLPVFLVVTIGHHDVMRIFGEEFTLASLPLAILAAGHMVNAAAAGAWNVLAMSGRASVKLSVDVGCALLNLALNVWLVPAWGIVGAAVATATSITCLSLGYMLSTYAIFGIDPYGRHVLKPGAAALAAAVAGWTLHTWAVDQHFIVSLGVTAMAVAIVYLATLTALGLEETDRDLLKTVRERLASNTASP